MPSRHAARRGWMDAAAARAAMLLAFSVPALVTLGVFEAKADEAYVCEGGRVVTVRMGELEVMKRKDPCIAAYYGVKLDAAAPGTLPVANIAIEAEPPLPVRKPARVAAAEVADEDTPKPTPAVADAASLPVASHAISPDIVTTPRVERVVFRHAQRPSADPVAPGATGKAPVDFRRVPIINAGPGTPGIFYHTR